MHECIKPRPMPAGNVVTRKRKIRGSIKVKTGCATCRIRKVKCDEKKPFCQRCVNTGRTCDGYKSPFRVFTSQVTRGAHYGEVQSDIALQSIPPTLTEIAPEDVELFNRYLSTKTMFDVDLDCEEEARQLLQASLTDPLVQHAVWSLRALRKDLETSGDDPTALAQQTPSYYFGLHQYNVALGGLASTLSSPSSNALKSALFCCQIFISIEQVRNNYAAMAQHIIRGLRIMHECRARPGFVTATTLLPAHHGQLPLLDVFIIKMFAAPCKFADPLSAADTSGVTSPSSSSGYSVSPHRRSAECRDLRSIAPNMRTELRRIASSTLEFLDKVSQVESIEVALRLLCDKAALLDSLRLWFIDLDISQMETRHSGPEPVSVSFLRIFHVILKIVLLMALDSSLDLHAELQIENERLQSIANDVGESFRTYTMRSGPSSEQSVRSRVNWHG